MLKQVSQVSVSFSFLYPLKIPDLEDSPEHWAGGSQHQPVGGEAGPRLVPGHQSHVTEVTRLQPIGSQYSGHVICLDQSEASSHRSHLPPSAG